MQSKTARRENGTVLLSSLVLVTVMLAISGYVSLFSVTEGKATIESRDRQVAFYLAEAGVENAKWELGEVQDPALDGVGNTTGSTSRGTYAVTSTDLGGGNYRLTSTGSSGGNNVTLEVIVRAISQSKFPPGAMSVVGGINDFDIDIEKDTDLIIDGGNSPAMSFSDVGVYNRVGKEFANAVDTGSLPATNITGSPLSPFTATSGNTVNLPIANPTTYDSALTNLTTLYTDLRDKVNALRPTATVVGPTFSSTYGSPGSPVTIYAPDINTVTNQSITGYGTLIVGDDFNLASGASLNWTGDIFVIGDSTNDAELKVSAGATLTVNGNLAILGEGAVDTEFEVTGGGQATINGSAFFGTDWTDPTGPETELEINNGGKFTVNGLLTMVGPEIEIEFIEVTSNPLNQISITGAMQIAVPNGVETSLELELHGAVEIIKDDQMIRNGANALEQLDVNYTLPDISRLINTNTITTYSWRRVNN